MAAPNQHPLPVLRKRSWKGMGVSALVRGAPDLGAVGLMLVWSAFCLLAAQSHLRHQQTRHIEAVLSVAGQRLQTLGQTLEGAFSGLATLVQALSRHEEVVNVLTFVDRSHPRLPQERVASRRVWMSTALELASLNRFFEMLARESGLLHLFLLDGNGICLASSNWQSPVSVLGEDFSAYSFVGEALAQGHGAGFVRGTNGKEGGFHFVASVSWTQQSRGMVVARLAPVALAPLMTDDGSEAFVTDAGGKIILSSDLSLLTRPVASVFNGTESAGLERALQEMKNRWERKNAGGEPSAPLFLPKIVSYQDRPQLALSRRLDERGQTLWIVADPEAEEQIQGYVTNVALLGIALGLTVIWSGRMALTHFLSRRRQGEKIAVLTQEVGRLRQDVQEQAGLDGLTGVASAVRLMERVTLEHQRCIRSNDDLSLIVLNVDGMRRLNEIHGHNFGDLVLRRVASVCQETLRTTDFLARQGGGDQNGGGFVILLPETGRDGSVLVAERLREGVNEIILAGRNGPVSPSICLGVALLRGQETPEHLLLRASQAMLKARETGPDTVVVAA